jgi:hypothetical protein
VAFSEHEEQPREVFTEEDTPFKKNKLNVLNAILQPLEEHKSVISVEE